MKNAMPMLIKNEYVWNKNWITQYNPLAHDDLPITHDDLPTSTMRGDEHVRDTNKTLSEQKGVRVLTHAQLEKGPLIDDKTWGITDHGNMTFLNVYVLNEE